MYREICVHALSSPYCLLPRAHTYTLAVVLILPLPQGWLFRAALAAFTTRTAVFAIDAAVQLSALRRGDVHAFPLDVLAALEMLGLASAVATFLLLVSRRGRESSARGLLRGWALAVGVGCVLAFVGVTELGRLATLAYPKKGHETCDGVSIDFDDVFGLPAVAVRVLGMMTSKTSWFAQRVGIASLLFAALAIISAAAASSEAPTNYDVDQKKDIWESDDKRSDSSSAFSTLVSLFSLLITLAVPAVSIFIAVSAEMYFNAMVGELPSAEKMTSVGQWGVWAATGAVVVATAVNAFKERMRSSNPKVVHEPYRSAV